MVIAAWPTDDDKDPVRVAQLGLLSSVLQIMLIDKVREELGDSYGASVGSELVGHLPRLSACSMPRQSSRPTRSTKCASAIDAAVAQLRSTRRSAPTCWPAPATRCSSAPTVRCARMARGSGSSPAPSRTRRGSTACSGCAPAIAAITPAELQALAVKYLTPAGRLDLKIVAACRHRRAAVAASVRHARPANLNCEVRGGSPIARRSHPPSKVSRPHVPPPPDLRRQGQDPLRGSRAGHLDPIFQGRRHRLQRAEARHDQRQGRAQQPHLGAYLHRAPDDRHPDPLHPPHQHARAIDPPGRDHPDRGRHPQRRRGLDLQAPRDRGRHPAAAHDHRILLQGRCAGRPDGRRRAYRLLRLGQPGRDERHRRHGDPRERLHVRDVRRRSASGWSTSSSSSAGCGKTTMPASSSPTRSAPTAAACGT